MSRGINKEVATMTGKGKIFQALSAVSLRDKERPLEKRKRESRESLFMDLPVLETQRLRLRAVTMRDAKDIHQYSSDPEVARYVLWSEHDSLSQTRAYIRYILRQYRAGEPTSFCIEHKETHKAIGTIGFMWLSSEYRSAEVGYSIAREHWNKGFMSEALAEVLSFGFEYLDLNRIEAQHDTRNPASGRVMVKVGMEREGTLRQRIYNKGCFVDVDMYAITRDRWVRQG